MANPCVHRDMCPNLCPCDYFEPVEQADNNAQFLIENKEENT